MIDDVSKLPAAAGRYLSELTDLAGKRWNRFWFTPSNPKLVCLLRVVFGALATLYVFSHSFELQRFFGPRGLLPIDAVHELLNPSTDASPEYRWSYLYLVKDGPTLWFVHIAGLVVTAAFTAGLLTRLTNVLTVVIVLSYIHRAPMLTGMWEPVLSMMLIYLCLSPCGVRWSVDAWRRRRRSKQSLAPMESVSATIAVRLMQLHFAAFCGSMGLMKLAGDTWWVGEAVWWLVARPDSRLVDLTALSSAFLLINLWTHAIVVFELSFGILIWFRGLRPLLLCLAAVMWGGLGLLTGEIAFFATLIFASLVFTSE